MSNLLIVFTLDDSDTSKAYFENLLNGNMADKNWKFLFFTIDKIETSDCSIIPDVILVNDLVIQDFNGFETYIINSINLYVVYHGNPSDKYFTKKYGRQNHDSLLELIKQTKKINNYYHKFDHHNYDGKIISQLENLVKNRGNIDGYNKSIKEIFNKIDWIAPDETIAENTLEAKLNLLHKCLTTEDLSNLNLDWLKGDEKTKFDVIRNMKNVGISDQIYINALSEFRDELLKDFF